MTGCLPLFAPVFVCSMLFSINPFPTQQGQNCSNIKPDPKSTCQVFHTHTTDTGFMDALQNTCWATLCVIGFKHRQCCCGLCKLSTQSCTFFSFTIHSRIPHASGCLALLAFGGCGMSMAGSVLLLVHNVQQVQELTSVFVTFYITI